ncbi:MAG: calcium/sodium antiporter [Candidatus Methanomethylophilaceae archaeon]|nr:calcium/sodium antiporter [Candidatus Methanomethylophilaceae archaeon]
MDWILLGIPVGIILLYFGSDWLVKGGKGLALRAGVPPFVIGLTVLAFGSSAPECVTSIVSTSNPGIIIGNVIGSNIANIGLAIGLAALVAPMAAKYSTMRFELAVMMVTTLALTVLAFIGYAGFWVGIAFVISLLVFIFVVYYMKKDDKEGQEAYSAEVEEDGPSYGYPALVVMVIAGLVLLYFGARFFVDGAVELASMLGMSDLLIGLIVVAIGTSLPEICISLIAAKRGENDLAVSNIVGSNIFNILFVLGIGASLVTVPIVDSVLVFHMPVMIVLSLLMIAAVRFKNGISRPVGALMIGIYAAYVAVMIAFPSLTL